MSSRPTHPVSRRRLRGLKLLTNVTVLSMLMTAFVLTGLGADAPEAEADGGAYTLNFGG